MGLHPRIWLTQSWRRKPVRPILCLASGQWPATITRCLEDADRPGRPPRTSLAVKCELVEMACEREKGVASGGPVPSGRRFRFAHTPLHASWVNQIEIWFFHPPAPRPQARQLRRRSGPARRSPGLHPLLESHRDDPWPRARFRLLAKQRWTLDIADAAGHWVLSDL